jgi:alkyl sulfatase BDS1-like metallo-beta-lactamase superfamily hydrolase
MKVHALVVLSLILSLPSIRCSDSEPDDAAADASEDISEASEDAEETPPPGALAQQCEEQVGEARVEELAPGLFLATGYDLANTILIQTDDGNVVVDVSMSPARAQEVKDALMKVAPGPTRAIIYTHSHLDHVGGASVWVEEGTEIWATDAFFPHLMKQYGSFRKAETKRAALMHATDLPLAQLPCSSLGKRVDLVAALKTGVRAPTHTFSGETTLEVGGVTIDLVEAHGETHDQLFVWLPTMGALLPGDNYYAAFPNLYTIRGTSPRPVKAWISSLDKMRRRQPVILVPSHTQPLYGQGVIEAALRDYRDAIQWVYDEVVRGANAVESVDSMAARIKLPEHLASKGNLRQLYGQVDWSVRGIYSSQMGWADGRADRLYPPAEVAAREIELMGGANKVMQTAASARDDGDLKWSTHLLGKLRDSGLVAAETLNPELSASYHALGLTIQNSNGRAYLLQSASVLKNGPLALGPVVVDEAFLEALPLTTFFEVLPARLKTSEAMEVEESLRFEFTDTGESFTLTVRRGVAELVYGDPLPGTGAPIGTLTTDSLTWKKLALGLLDQLKAVQDGLLSADDLLAVVTFMGRFDQSL